MARKSQKRNIRKDFIILTNGEGTEKNYFELLKSCKSIYDVKVEVCNKAPIALVEHAISQFSRANQVWCVFDVDSFHSEGKVEPCFNKIKGTNVNIALSNIAFEVWLLSYFRKCTREYSAKELQKELSKELTAMARKTIDYSKNDKELLKRYFLKGFEQAITNAKVVHETKLLEHKESGKKDEPLWDWNPCTSVYKLIEALKLQKK